VELVEPVPLVVVPVLLLLVEPVPVVDPVPLDVEPPAPVVPVDPLPELVVVDPDPLDPVPDAGSLLPAKAAVPSKPIATDAIPIHFFCMT
jgi:hypothetical protein